MSTLSRFISTDDGLAKEDSREEQINQKETGMIRSDRFLSLVGRFNSQLEDNGYFEALSNIQQKKDDSIQNRQSQSDIYQPQKKEQGEEQTGKVNVKEVKEEYKSMDSK